MARRGNAVCLAFAVILMMISQQTRCVQCKLVKPFSYIQLVIIINVCVHLWVDSLVTALRGFIPARFFSAWRWRQNSDSRVLDDSSPRNQANLFNLLPWLCIKIQKRFCLICSVSSCIFLLYYKSLKTKAYLMSFNHFNYSYRELCSRWMF